MNVPTIAEPREDAQRKLAAYRDQLRRRADAEYETAAEAYQALADGRILLDLQEVFRDCPTDDKDRPLLAIARADRTQVEFRCDGTRLCFDTRAINAWSDTLLTVIDAGRARDSALSWIGSRGYALVPMVPADVRPSGPLSRYFVLWEVKQWSDRRLGAQPPYDPYLLQHLAGTLYAVVAEWDLTDLERAIMRGRADG